MKNGLRFCRHCQLYTHTCLHQERRKIPREPFPRLHAWWGRHESTVVVVLIFGLFAWVVGGVWGLW